MCNHRRTKVILAETFPWRHRGEVYDWVTEFNWRSSESERVPFGQRPIA